MAVLIFKAIERCNANCVYCDVITRHQRAIMSQELLELVFKKINDYLLAEPREHLVFTWHGGEACLLGADYFKKALEFQERHCPTTKDRIEHLIQSNLTLLTQDMIDVFKQLSITTVGSSFEPLPNIRGFGQKRDSLAYNRRFFEGVNLLEENHLSWGVIYVVHKKSLSRPLEIFEFLANLNLRSFANYNGVNTFGEDPFDLSITAEEYADFLGAIFPRWWKHRERYGDVQPFGRLVKNIVYGQMDMVCESSGDCAYNLLYIGPEGETSLCGCSGDQDLLNFGNIKDFSMSDLFHNKQREVLVQRQAFLARNTCKECRFWGLCHGGCPTEARMERGDFTKPSKYCEGKRIFIERYFEPITNTRANFKPKSEDLGQS